MHNRWFYSRDVHRMLGPYTAKELKQLASTGQLLPTDRVLKEGMERAVTARRVKGLFATAAGQGESGTP